MRIQIAPIGSLALAFTPILVISTMSSAYGALPTVAAGSEQSCALAEGRACCWGWNSDGQLGNGTKTDSRFAVEVSGIASAATVAAGHFHSCAVLDDGTARCWGQNLSGQLGNGAIDGTSGTCLYSLGDFPTPVEVSDIDNATLIATDGQHTCVVADNGSAKCWGKNHCGQLGNANLEDNSACPTDVMLIAPAIAVAARADFSCAVLENGAVWCWGKNTERQLGNGKTAALGGTCTVTSTSSTTVQATPDPVEVMFPPESGIGTTTEAIAIATGGEHACAVVSMDGTEGTVWCWGKDFFGQLGNGGGGSSSMTNPVWQVTGINSATAVGAGLHHTCALLSNGGVKCWGRNNYGQLGNEGDANSQDPVDVQGLPDTTDPVNPVLAVAIGVAAKHACAGLSDGSVRCWGRNNKGQLGDGTIVNSKKPVMVQNFPSCGPLDP